MRPKSKMWLKRLVLFLVVGMFLSQAPYMLLVVCSWLLGRWGLPQKIVYRALRLRLKRRSRLGRPDPAAAS